MTKFRLFATLFALALTASPAFARDDSSANSLTQNVSETAPPAAPVTPDPALAMANSASGSDALANFGPSSGTVVGNRAQALRDEVLRLRSSVNLNSNEFAILRTSGAAGAVQYHSTVAAITARLQNGTTKGNPILLRQWEEADTSLNEVNSSLNKLNSLQVSIDADASVASYLLDSVQAAMELSGAVDEDHDQLKLLHDEVSRLVVQLDYLRNQTTADIQRQSTYMTTERANLQTLAFAISRGELLGGNLSSRAAMMPGSLSGAGGVSCGAQCPAPAVSTPISTSPVAPYAAPALPVTQGAIGPEPMSPRDLMTESGGSAPAQDMSGSNSASNAPPQSVGRLLVLIRFNQPNVEYEQQLSQAVSSAMNSRPNAEFTVVAVSPAQGDAAMMAEDQRVAASKSEDVKRTLLQLGLTSSRIAMASTQAQTAQSPEVHVYIR